MIETQSAASTGQIAGHNGTMAAKNNSLAQSNKSEKGAKRPTCEA
jgi:hypothetical protein